MREFPHVTQGVGMRVCECVGESAGLGEDRCARRRGGVYLGVSWAWRKEGEGLAVSTHGCVRCDAGTPSVRLCQGCETAVCLRDLRVPGAQE